MARVIDIMKYDLFMSVVTGLQVCSGGPLCQIKGEEGGGDEREGDVDERIGVLEAEQFQLRAGERNRDEEAQATDGGGRGEASAGRLPKKTDEEGC